MNTRFFFLGLLACFLIPFSAMAQDSVREIRVNGVERIEPATVLTYLDIKMGEPLTSETMDRGLKNLFATGLFADVKLRQERSALVVDVVENPIINQIAFEGNTEIKDEELLSEISLRPRQVFTRTKVQNDVARVFDVYQRSGRFAANVDPKVIELDQNRVNLVFEVQEGNVTTIKGIRFVGNEAFSDDALRAELASEEERWYKFFSSSDTYDPDKVEFDKEQLRRFYLANGYADFRVVSAVAELSQNKEDFYLTFTVDEGARYKVGQIAIDSSLKGFDAGALRESVKILPGEWYDADMIEASTTGMADILGDKQYAFVDITPDIVRNQTSNTVDITFNIGESPRVFVERIDIHGNVRTIDKVIRRELKLSEGDPFNRSKLAQSEQHLRDLGFFENVTIKTIPGSAPDKTVVDIEVAEKSTGEISIGAGFSTQDGPLADLSIRERNLLGKGQQLSFSTTIAGSRSEFDVSFTEPYFMDRDLSAGFDVFHVTTDFQDESSYDQKRTGGKLRAGYPLSEHWRQTWFYGYEQNEITDVDSNASLFIRRQEGKRDTSSIGQRLTFDDRDSTLFPTEGLYSWLDTAVAGLGGDAKYVSGKLGGVYYYPVYEKSVIFSLLGEAGAIGGYSDEDVKINERYYLGGNTLRGFERSGIGPRDRATDDALGGNLYYRGSAELTFPIGLPEEYGVSGHTFTDFGSLWELDDTGPGIVDKDSIRAAAGLGISWRSGFGPIRVDVAFPIAKEDFDKEEAFRFSFGTRF
ncbi:MAG: outer membrane protein assembly factor BamA [Alphaproteobacteria bacterium]|nr:outer membrane protein assembly factor BamA [Alphaproteobacteria bacterium]